MRGWKGGLNKRGKDAVKDDLRRRLGVKHEESIKVGPEGRRSREGGGLLVKPKH